MIRRILFATALGSAACIGTPDPMGRPCDDEGRCPPGLVCSETRKCVRPAPAAVDAGAMTDAGSAPDAGAPICDVAGAKLERFDDDRCGWTTAGKGHHRIEDGHLWLEAQWDNVEPGAEVIAYPKLSAVAEVEVSARVRIEAAAGTLVAGVACGQRSVMRGLHFGISSGGQWYLFERNGNGSLNLGSGELPERADGRDDHHLRAHCGENFLGYIDDALVVDVPIDEVPTASVAVFMRRLQSRGGNYRARFDDFGVDVPAP